jgi:hypothetical protein
LKEKLGGIERKKAVPLTDTAFLSSTTSVEQEQLRWK